MNPALAAVAIAILAGAVAAVFVRDARVAVISLAVVLLATPFLADPIAPASGLVARVLGAVLATYLLWIPVRDGAFPTGGSRLGWAADGLVAAAAATVGFASHGLGAPTLGPALASACGFALAALAVAPLLTGRDVLRVGIGLSLLLQGALRRPVRAGRHAVDPRGARHGRSGRRARRGDRRPRDGRPHGRDGRLRPGR